jgi:two-component system, LytTR family, response regulator
MTDELKLRVLIADDEPPARARVRRFLADEPDVLAIHEAWDGPTTLRVIREAAPDIVFLDITMPGMSGIDIAESLPAGAGPHIIFVTAHDDFAVRAFDVPAVDFLLKPFDDKRFRRALDRARKTLTLQRSTDDVARLARLVHRLGAPARPHLERILVEDGHRRTIIAFADVDRVEADRNYVLLHTGRAVHRVRGTITDLEAQLDPAQFARVSRGTIVALKSVAHLEPAGHGDYDITLRDGVRVRLSRRYAAGMAGRLGL